MNEPVLRVAELWRHPVKAMLGERIDGADLHELGLDGDRIWAARDEQRAGIQGGRKLGGLMRCAATLGPDGTVEITMPDGTRVQAGEPDAERMLSDLLDRPVTLWPLQPADDLDHYRRSAPDDPDFMAELTSIFGREPGEPLPDFSVFPPTTLEFESPPGSYVDVYPLLLMTTSALASLAAALPDSVPDVRRFRPNVVLDSGTVPGHPEFDWSGRRLAIGTAVLELVAPCPRCVAVTRPLTDELGEDRAVLRHIVRELDQNVGIYARVARPGRVGVGDEAVFVD